MPQGIIRYLCEILMWPERTGATLFTISYDIL